MTYGLMLYPSQLSLTPPQLLLRHCQLSPLSRQLSMLALTRQ
jgi:hypothetical protein